jgi:hypothetical protein
MTRRMILLALLSAMMLIVAACEETTPERITDDTDDVAVDEPAAEPEDEEGSSDDTVVIEDEDDASEDASGGDDATEEEQSTDGDADDSVENEPGTSDEPSGGDGELEEAEGFTVGDTVQMGNLVMTLHSVRWDEGGEFMSPDEGMRWLVADIEIENEADSATSISSLLMFDLVDQDNRKRDIAFMADTEGSLDGELGAGRSLRGDLRYQ